MVEIFGNSAESAVRTGIVSGLPTTGNPEDALWAAMTATGMPITGTPYPNRTNCFLTRIQVFGISHEFAKVKLIYEPFQGVGTSLIIRIGATLSNYATNMLPGATRTALKVGFTPADSKLEKIPEDFLTINMLRPLRRVSVTQLRAGTLDVAEATTFSDFVGRVNNATWLGKPAGSWIVNNADATISKYGGYYQRTIEGMSQGNDLWRYFGVLRSHLTGKYAIDTNTQTAINTLRSNAYSYGVQTGNGVLAVDPYETTNFTTLFGF